jgi:hypothetical protein
VELPPLLELDSEDEYFQHYVNTLVKDSPFVMPDGTKIIFYGSVFGHAFYGYSSRWLKKKDIFDKERARRMDWIRATLTDSNSKCYKETITARKIHRIVLTGTGAYLVITEVIRKGIEKFITAFPCSNEKAAQVRTLPQFKINGR